MISKSNSNNAVSIVYDRITDDMAKKVPNFKGSRQKLSGAGATIYTIIIIIFVIIALLWVWT